MNKKTWPRFFLVLFIAALMGSYYYYKAKKLEKFNYDGTGIIYDIEERHTIKSPRRSRGYFIEYKYEVDGKVYESDERIGHGKKNRNKYNVGDSIRVIIGCTDPSLVDVK